MFRLLQTSNNIVLILLVVYVLIIRLPILFAEPAIQSLSDTFPGTWLWNMLMSVGSLSVFLHYLLSSIIVIIQAILLNHILDKHNFFVARNYYSALFYILCCSLFSEFMHISAPLLANFFLLLLMERILSFPLKQNEKTMLFDAGLFVGLATLLHTSYILFFVIIVIAQWLFRTFNIREMVLAGLGLFTPLFLFYTGCYMFQKPEYFPALLSFHPFSGLTSISSYQTTLPVLALLIGVIIWASSILLKKINSIPSHSRKTLTIFFWFFVVSAISVVLKGNYALSSFISLMIPVSVLLAYHFYNLKHLWVTEAIHWLIFIIAGSVSILGITLL